MPEDRDELFMRRFAVDLGEGVAFRGDMLVRDVVAAQREIRLILAKVDAAQAEAEAA